jgi:phospholipid-translocating ATPase
VLGCRATPLQKAYIVKLVKEQLKMHTLAVGKSRPGSIPS